MDINTTYVGRKFYKYIDGELYLLKVLVDKDPNSFKCSVGGTGKRVRISKQELDDDFIRLRPDGVLYFNIATVGEVEDVIIMLYRAKDIDMAETTPYVVCRQNITDLLANTIIRPDYKDLITGLAISKESLPEGVDMNTVLACDGIKKIIPICVYLDDTLDDILSLIKTKDYDNVLYNLFMDHVKYKYKDNKTEYVNKDLVDGYCKSLRALMESNEFSYEFCRAYDMYPVTFTISDKEINSKLSLSNATLLSTILMKKIKSSIVVEYDKTIELNKIQFDYVLIRDAKNKTYLVSYTHSGAMEIPVDKIETPENIKKMATIPGYAFNKDVQKAVRFNTSKYQ